MLRTLTVSLAVFAAAAPAAAQEAFVGVLDHGVDTPFTFDTGEGGADLQLGYRFKPIDGLAVVGRPAPYVIASLNTRGDTSFAGAGLAWTIGRGRVYVRPGVGVVVHTGPSYRVNLQTLTRTDLGSRVLFEPELSVGLRISERVALEANWTHISHARLFDSGQNPGIDMMGVRVSYRTR